MTTILRRAPRRLCTSKPITTQHFRPHPTLPILQTHSIHSSTTQSANPINHPSAPGPPPKPPIPEPSADTNRVDRKKRNAELIERGRALKSQTTTTPQPTGLQRRFWKDVRVERAPDGWQIYLDNRALRTPARTPLTVPLGKPHLATAIALEWDLLVSAQQALKQHYIPLTSMTARALDIARADAAGDASLRDGVISMAMRYLTTDTLLCWAPEKNVAAASDTANSLAASMGTPQRAAAAAGGPGSLRERQKAAAAPIIEVLTTRVWPGTQLLPALGQDSILPMPQPEDTTRAIEEWMRGLGAWELAALERGVLASKSVCVASRLLVQWSSEGGRAGEATARPRSEAPLEPFTVEDAAEACSIEVRWQTGMWGEVEDTHDVEREDIRRQLGSVVLLVS